MSQLPAKSCAAWKCFGKGTFINALGSVHTHKGSMDLGGDAWAGAIPASSGLNLGTRPCLEFSPQSNAVMLKSRGGCGAQGKNHGQGDGRDTAMPGGAALGGG